MKKVKFKEYIKQEDGKLKLVEMPAICIFHSWGCDYEEFESGPGNYSTAIIELPDGTIKNIYAELIRFL